MYLLDLIKRESFGEDIVDTDMEKGSSDEYDYSDSFINDDDPSGRGSHVSSTDDDEGITFPNVIMLFVMFALGI